MLGKSLRVYLPDATVGGIKYAELVNWTGQAIACPRSRLSELPEWPASCKPGVYFLFENRYGDTKPIAYIGESENVMKRITSHDRQKDFWYELVLFTSKDENLTKSHIKYLESALIKLAKTAGRYDLENSTAPDVSSLPRPDVAAMEEFIVNLRMVLGILGHPILEPILRHDLPKQTEELISNLNTLNNIDLIFTVNNLTAHGTLTDEGFVLKKGSQLSLKNTESIPGKLITLKNRLMQSGEIIQDGNYFRTTTDIILGSSSYAAAIVAGTSRSGPQSWKNREGITLKNLEESKAPKISNPLND